MLKKLLCIFSILFILPVYSGEYEDALNSNDKVFLYMYTQQCGYCRKFEPIYNKLRLNNAKSCKFLKIDASSRYGNGIMRDLGAAYVPYVVVIDTKRSVARSVAPSCLLDYACIKDVVDKFVID